jgi:hypothetical protein
MTARVMNNFRKRPDVLLCHGMRHSVFKFMDIRADGMVDRMTDRNVMKSG